jgi:hypothetical protein
MYAKRRFEVFRELVLFWDAKPFGVFALVLPKAIFN